jgi:Winged helix-turn helix
LHDAHLGGIVVIPRIKPLVERALGQKIAPSGLYRMLHRHGWRKLAPHTQPAQPQQPKGNPQVREVWKKNSPS